MIAPRCGANELLVHLDASQRSNGFCGTVLAVGEEVQEVASGQSVFGQAAFASAAGANICCRRNRVAIKPARLGIQEAAALASTGPLALQAIRLAGVRSGMRLLVQDASSCFGALVLQIAKSVGAHVTGLCPDRNVPLVWDLGADAVGALERDRGHQYFDAFICSASVAFQDPSGRIAQSRNSSLFGEVMVRVVDDALALYSASYPHWRDCSVEADRLTLEALACLVEREGIFPIAPCFLGA